jgi:predicted transcriptional regulator
MITPQSIITKLILLGVTQSEIAFQAGLTQGRISHILNSGGDCSFSAGNKLTKFLESKTPPPPSVA